jgi:hypothetical protein
MREQSKRADKKMSEDIKYAAHSRGTPEGLKDHRTHLDTIAIPKLPSQGNRPECSQLLFFWVRCASWGQS